MPALHWLPAQQGCPREPQLVPHTLVVPHARPTLQVRLAQQAWPALPQAVHDPDAQAKPTLHALLAQQGWLAPPQAWQVLLRQARVLVLQELLLQQGWPALPHTDTRQVPLRHARLSWQAAPEVQQLWPAPPQAMQTLLLQRAPVPQALLAQQGCPGPPQVWHSPPEPHARPVPQAGWEF